jgi:valyl-tRNA synthetase
MDTRYEPHGVEERWQRTWEDEGLYNAEADDPREPFVIAHPPPNVTGELHIGHALQLALEDALVRWKRMQGYNALFQTGYDHAGISTQYQVEKDLESRGERRQDLGRERFEELVWDWLRRYGRTIMSQFRRLGASMDYRRERFTLDDGYTRAVMRFFVHLWERGYLYRANRIVNWCPYHQSALSDLELDHVEVDDELVSVRYPLAEGDGHVTIATVRPATILADVAVAVHPDDERYRHLVGQKAIVPYVERPVPIIADERVEPEFGTGALKVTPGHDPVDFEIGRDHGLPEPMVIGPDGRMNEHAGDLAGLTQEEAGARVLAWCEARGLIEQAEPYTHSITVCERCESRIEPLISLQWWCRMDELKQPALEALRERRVYYHPESQHRFAIESLENAPDWNISRQLWWGHQLPVWYCPDGHITVAEDEPAACAECRSAELRREEDVLDTWFSSALWPFATLGWPDDTAYLRRFYPGDLNATAREIIRLWENRMIFSGLELMGDVPFKAVLIHSTVLAPDGRRMSKSLGTGIDPVEIIDRYGADAARYGLLKVSSQQDTRFSYAAIEEGRKLANKLWNVARLIVGATEGAHPAIRPQSLEEAWIVARLNMAQAEWALRAESFDFAGLVSELYHLTFDDFCDWYAEAVKPRLYDGDEDAQATALGLLERLLKYLHPIMPHVTEEIWTQLPDRDGRLILAPPALRAYPGGRRDLPSQRTAGLP